MTIPASAIVSVNPSVLGAGGNPLALNGMLLSDSGSLPYGVPLSFSTAKSVSDYFGASSVEAEMAAVYFAGYVGCTQLPSALLLSRYPLADIPAFLRGASNGVTLADCTAITTGTMNVTVDGTPIAATGIDFSGATSLAQVATLLQAELAGTVVTYDTTFKAFVVTSATSGATSTITYATGTVATLLGLVDGEATISQGADQTTPAAHMDSIIAVTQNWASFATTFEPDLADAEAFAVWTSQTDGRYLYASWDTDSTAAQNPNTFAGLGKYLADNALSGTCLVWQDYKLAAFVLGCVASMDFGRTNGRITLAFKTGSAAFTSVTDQTVADNLLANGYNFYGRYATANDQFVYFYNGQVSGEYGFVDAYVDAIWLTNQCQLALMELLTNVGSIPYTPAGYGLIKSALQDPINQALNFGAIRSNVALSALQAAQVDSAAGVPISGTLSTRGWYLQVLDPGAQARQNRTSPSCTLWYTDGGSVQKINLNSIDVL